MTAHTLRVYDPARQPPGWSEIVRPDQYVAFATDLATGVPCDAAGRPFTSSGDVTCVVFDTLDEARQFCDDAVTAAPGVQFDLFDANGRANPPLVQIVHPSHAAALDSDPRTLARRRLSAFALLAAGLSLIAIDAWLVGELLLITMVGITLVLAAGRLLFLNLAFRDAERRRLDRLAARERPSTRERA